MRRIRLFVCFECNEKPSMKANRSMKMKTRRLRWLSIVCITGASLSTTVAQLPTPTPADLPPLPYAQITYGDGSLVVAPGSGGTFPLIGLQPAQPIQVVVQLTPNHALQLYMIEALDGGEVIPPAEGSAPMSSPGQSLAPIPDVTTQSAQLAFTFVPGLLPGSYRIALRNGTRSMLLEFWVQDPNNPQVNPPTITSTAPNNY
jgi:hypothetical protein